ncbi:hypothetical protein [Pandoraea apista]|uniref:Lipoprotein n=1 Tax=Pandoraea apista TaxID=93218 RepID=A0ABX9ZSM6_9BURK|nr:hypothetical protein [Pandoraea apista]RRJ30924.1 hypothetical protein EIB05_13255 [Pandoraea apista]RRJ79532.1 hypothetical protein EIL82_13485 [Pandoraea apista]RSD12368.1 hypothetical protein EJB12_11820 [Pandoraea apista]RSD22601.1 hypothetical protein EIZ52_05295 [Pandoraea apista]RSK83937.1 hypothetical protein EJE96_09615 [Pandoraea apista]
MKSAIRGVGALCVAVACLAGCASEYLYDSYYNKQMGQYMSLPYNKALAFAKTTAANGSKQALLDPVGGRSSPEQAKADALDLCRSVIKRTGSAVREDCRIVRVNDQVVEDLYPFTESAYNARKASTNVWADAVSAIAGGAATGVAQSSATRSATQARVVSPVFPAANGVSMASVNRSTSTAIPAAATVATPPPVRNHPENVASSCIRTRRGNQGNFGYGMEMVNDCGYVVEVAWCAIVKGNAQSCAHGFDSMEAIGPGKSWPVDALAGKDVVEVKFGACKGPNGLQDVNINNSTMRISCGPYPN